MYCPKCRSEYRDGINECAHCEVELINELPDEDPFSSPEKMGELLSEKEVEAIVVGNYTNLRQAQTELAAQRIPSAIAGEAEGEEMNQGIHSRFYLMVAVEDLDKTRQFFTESWDTGLKIEGLMLKDPQDNNGIDEQSNLSCPACGTHVPPDVSECPECELFLGPQKEG